MGKLSTYVFNLSSCLVYSYMIQMLVIDDHPLVAGGIKSMLTEPDEIAVTGSATTAKEGLALLSLYEYDIILLDIDLPDMDGLSVCKEIRKSNKEVKIIGLTSSNETGIITQLLQLGGNGYLLKNMDRAELLEAIAMVMDDKIFLSKAANEKILEQYRSVDMATGQIPILTRREKEVLELLNEGLTGPDIAKQLFISPHTVESHRKNLMQKFNVNNVQMLLKLGRQYKVID